MTEREVADIVTADPWRASVIHAVAALNLPEAWIAGGFVRNTVWDHLYGMEPARSFTDIDVVYFKPLDSYGVPTEPLLAAISANEPNPVWEEERAATEALSAQFPDVDFEVKNQARMHLSQVKAHLARPAYASLSDAVADWVETATAVGIREEGEGGYAILSPHGLEDLGAGVVRPTQPEMRARALERAEKKGWFARWPQLRFEEPWHTS